MPILLLVNPSFQVPCLSSALTIDSLPPGPSNGLKHASPETPSVVQPHPLLAGRERESESLIYGWE